jgi:hypothetical protein
MEEALKGACSMDRKDWNSMQSKSKKTRDAISQEWKGGYYCKEYCDML